MPLRPSRSQAPSPPADADRARSRTGLRARAVHALEVACWLVAAGLALASIGQYLGIVRATIAYPFHLEWMEGGVVESAARVLRGEPLYPEPSIDYVGYIYAPFYFWVTAAVGGAMGGVDLIAARLVSLFAILGCAAVIYRWIWRETADDLYRTRWGLNLWGLLGVGLLVSTYEASGRWFHLARVDSLALLLLLWGAYVLRFHGRLWRGAAVAAVLLWLSALTKQSSLVPIALLLLAALAADWRRGLFAGALCTALTLGSALWLQLASDGWFLYYIWEVGSQHDRLEQRLLGFWASDLARMGVPLAFSVLGVTLPAARNGRGALVAAALLVGLLVMSWMSRLHQGGFLNVLMPAFAGLALFMPIGLARLAERVRRRERARFGGSVTAMGLAALVAFQFAATRYETAPALPEPGSVERGERFLRQIGAIEGEVLIPDMRWLQTRAGKRSYGLGMAARDLLRVEDPADRGRVALEASLARAFAERRFTAVILSQDKAWFGMAPHYRSAYRIDSAPMPVTGWRNRPVFVWIPR